MDVEFLNAKLKRLCEEKSARQKEWQKAAADKLAARLDDLRAAAHLEVLRTLPGKWEELTGDRKGQLSWRLDQKLRLGVCAAEPAPALGPNRGGG